MEVKSELKGGSVTLAADIATPFGLVLHELATNAAKHGALSVPDGKVSVSWQVEGRNPQRLRVLWQESNGPAVAKPGRAGFGSILIERGIPDARVRREYRSNGVTCRIDFPLPEPAAHERRSETS